MKNRYAILVFGVVGIALAGTYLFARQEGYLVIDAPGVTLQLQGAFGHHRTLESRAEPVAVPAHTHRPTSLELRWMRDGDTWQMWSQGPWGELGRIRVQRGQTTTIRLGPPLLVKPNVGILQGQVSVDLRIFGQAGEQYTNLICRNDRRIAAPQVAILDEAGTVLASGAFEYG
ncbi:MAG: hypothetical protein ABFD90_07770 [Phycisphaerales bacterium]